MTTSLDIIKQSMQKIGAITRNEEPSADEANDALRTLNALLSSWANESLSVFSRTWETFSLVASQSDYTMGPGGDFDTVRPVNIIQSYYRWDTSDYPLKSIADDDYNSYITQKNQPGLPLVFNYDNAYPLGKLRLWPVPNIAASIFILSEKELGDLTLNQTVAFPPGWERALVHNLALELAPEYGQEVLSSVQRIAADSLAAIRRAVSKVRSYDVSPVRLNPFDILTGRGW